jgi:IclR helix-turn-helix domain
MRSGSVREKFGLSWLNPNSQPSGSLSAPNDAPAVNRPAEQIDAALVALAVKVASKLSTIENKTAGFSELIDKTGMPLSQLIRIVSYLEQLGWVQYVDKDKIQLTPKGANTIS